MNNDLAIDIRHLTKEYTILKKKGSKSIFKAIDDLSVSIEKGKVMGIIGSNGAGKSTLLKILSRITYPSSGEVAIHGNLSSLLEVGTGFHPELSGRENIFLNGAILGMSRREIRERFNDIVDFSGIEEFIDTPVKHYSSGMYVRLAFSVAANLSPDILLIDEVLAVGDAEFQKRCLQRMDDAKTIEHRTVLFVSHNMNAIRQLCDEVIWLKEGKVHQIGDPDITTMNYLRELKDTSDKLEIRERRDRKGTGESKIVKLWWESSHDLLISGKPATLNIEFESENIKIIPNLNFRINIFKENGEFLTSLSNEMSGFPFISQKSHGKVSCFMAKLPLTAGSYYITSNLFVNGLKSDKVERALNFTVEEGSYYNSIDTNIEKKQGIYIDQSWSIKDTL